MKGRFSAADLARTGLFAALILICTHLSIPLPSGVPLTLQTFAVALGGFLLGPVYGTLAVAVYLGFTGGIGRFVGPTGGFLLGFLLLAWGCGLGKKRPLPIRFLPGLAGLLLCHLLGALWYARIAGLAFTASAAAVSLPFLPKDIASLALALVFARLLEKRGIRQE